MTQMLMYSYQYAFCPHSGIQVDEIRSRSSSSSLSSLSISITNDMIINNAERVHYYMDAVGIIFQCPNGNPWRKKHCLCIRNAYVCISWLRFSVFDWNSSELIAKKPFATTSKAGQNDVLQLTARCCQCRWNSRISAPMALHSRTARTSHFDACQWVDAFRAKIS